MSTESKPYRTPSVYRAQRVTPITLTLEYEGMSVRRVIVRGRPIWQARVAVAGLRKSRTCRSMADARDAEATLLQQLKRQAATAAMDGGQPATLQALFEGYVGDLAA